MTDGNSLFQTSATGYSHWLFPNPRCLDTDWVTVFASWLFHQTQASREAPMTWAGLARRRSVPGQPRGWGGCCPSGAVLAQQCEVCLSHWGARAQLVGDILVWSSWSLLSRAGASGQPWGAVTFLSRLGGVAQMSWTTASGREQDSSARLSPLPQHLLLLLCLAAST